jgi:hypothetical protein
MRPRSSGTSTTSTRGDARTAASPGALSAKKSLGLQLRGERDWKPAQRHRDGYLDRRPLIGYERIAAIECALG